MATLRVSEKEALRRGWIPASESTENVRYLRVPVKETRTVYLKTGFTVWHAVCIIGGWLLGFATAILFL